MNGFTVPNTPGFYEFEVYAVEDNTLVEISFPKVYISPVVTLTDLSITLSNLQIAFDSVLAVSFTNVEYIPPGYLNEVNYDSGAQGYMQVSFEIFESFDDDLGYYDTDDVVPCLGISGIIAKPGDNLKCVFTMGDATLTRPSNSYITITNFQAILKDTIVKIHFSKLKNGPTATHKPKVGFGIYKKLSKDEIVWIYDTDYITLGPLSAGSPSSLAAPNTLTTSSSVVGATTTLSLPLTTTTSLAANTDSIVVEFPLYFTLPSSGLTINIKNGGSNVLSSLSYQTYPETGNLLIYIGSAALTANTYTIEMQRMVNPISKFSCDNCPISYYTIVSGNLKDRFLTNDIDTDLALTPETAILSVIELSDYTAEAVNVHFSAILTPNIYIPKNGLIQVHLPTDFPAFHQSDPIPTCEIDGLVCSLNNIVISISGFIQSYDGDLTINVKGIKNPIRAGDTLTGVSGFKVFAYDEDRFFVISSQLSNTITILSKSSIPNLLFSLSQRFKAQGIRDEYTFRVYIPLNLPISSVIKISFPVAFDLYDLLDVNTDFLASFEKSSNLLVLRVEEEIIAFSYLNIKLKNVLNPNQLSLASLKIETLYDKTVVAASSPVSLILAETPEVLTVKSWDFYPKNSGEHANYAFNVSIPFKIAYNSANAILIVFPDQYAEDLIPNDIVFYCDSDTVFKDCNFIGNREILFSNPTVDLESRQAFTLSMFGIGNPSAGITSFLEIYLVDTDSNIASAYSYSALVFNILQAPGIVPLKSVETSKSTMTALTTYTFSIALQNEEFLRTDVIWLDWPKEISKLFGATTCTADLFVNDKANTLSCKLLEYTSNSRSELGNLPGISAGDSIKIVAYDIPTPESADITQRFSVRFANTSVVKFRSYDALTQIPSLSYIGSSFSISSPSSVTVIRGTYSESLTLKLQVPTFTKLFISLTSSNSLIRLNPSTIEMQYSWNTNAEFRIGAKSSLNLGSYLVSWNVDSESSESASYDTPNDIIVNVLPESESFRVSIDDISDMHVLGTSIPIYVRLERPVVDYLIISISAGSTPDSYIIDPVNLIFNEGNSVKSFTIKALDGAITSWIDFEKSGPSAGCFYLEEIQKPLIILTSAKTEPKILSVQASKIARTSAQFKVSLNTPGYIHYMYSYSGTEIPTVADIDDRKKFGTDVFHAYGVTSTQPQVQSGYILIENLRDETEYMLTLMAVGIDGNRSLTTETRYFKTANSYKPVSFKVYTTELSSPSVVIAAVAKVLALPTSIFYLTGVDPANYDIFNRRLTSVLFYEITLFADKSLEMKSPNSYINTLENKMSLLKSYLPVLDSDYPISGIEVTYEKPEFEDGPYLVSNTTEKIVFQAKLNGLGKIKAIALALGENKPRS